MRMLITLLSLSLVPGCAVLNRLAPVPSAPPVAEAAPAPLPAAVAAPPAVLGAGRTAAALDTTSAAEKSEALAAPVAASEQSLGKVAVSLGSPAEQGFWLRSSLVKAPGKGRVETAGGKSVAVDLLPGTSGAQLSLAAFRALGLSLTALPEVTVYAN